MGNTVKYKARLFSLFLDVQLQGSRRVLKSRVAQYTNGFPISFLAVKLWCHKSEPRRLLQATAIEKPQLFWMVQWTALCQDSNHEESLQVKLAPGRKAAERSVIINESFLFPSLCFITDGKEVCSQHGAWEGSVRMMS